AHRCRGIVRLREKPGSSPRQRCRQSTGKKTGMPRTWSMLGRQATRPIARMAGQIVISALRSLDAPPRAIGWSRSGALAHLRAGLRRNAGQTRSREAVLKARISIVSTFRAIAAIIALCGGTFAAGPTAAHELRPAIATAILDRSGAIELRVTLNLEAYVAGIGALRSD